MVSVPRLTLGTNVLESFGVAQDGSSDGEPVEPFIEGRSRIISMAEYKVMEKKRSLRQFFMAIIFLIILIGGWHYPLLGYFIPLCMLLGIGIGLLKGRKWCDWFCPRGSFFDTSTLLYFGRLSIALKRAKRVEGLSVNGERSRTIDMMIKPISPKREIPRFFKGLPLRIVMLSFLMLMMTIQIIKRWPDPYKIGMFFVILLTVTTIVGVLLALIFHQRTWCCFCPIGSVAGWVGRKRYLLKIDSKLCTECKLCYKVCPIQVAPYTFKSQGVQLVKDGDCLKCELCVLACPTKALKI